MSRKQILIRWIILALALISMTAGIFSGECETVFTKATNVCLECIGIG